MHARTYIRTCIHTYNTHTSTHLYTHTTNIHTLALSLPRTLSPSLSFSFSHKHEQENRKLPGYNKTHLTKYPSNRDVATVSWSIL